MHGKLEDLLPTTFLRLALQQNSKISAFRVESSPRLSVMMASVFGAFFLTAVTRDASPKILCLRARSNNVLHGNASSNKPQGTALYYFLLA